MVNDGTMSHCSKDCLNMKIKHGPTSHCDKDCLNMKMNHGKPLLTMFILGFIVFILGIIYLGFIILIPWVYYSL